MSVSLPVAHASPAVPLPLPRALLEKLVRVRRTRRFLAVFQAAMVLIGALCLLWLAQGTADNRLVLSWISRALLLAVDGLLLIGLYLLCFRRTFRRDQSLVRTALAAETKWPQLNQCLISAVELSEGHPGTTRGSNRLAQEVIVEAHRRAQSLDFNQLVPWRGRLWCLGGLAMLLVTGAVMSAVGLASWILLGRIVLLPLTQTVVIPVTRDLDVATDSDVVLSARATGRIPAEGVVTVEFVGEPRQELPVTADPDHPGIFTLTVPNVQRPFTYRFRLNDGSTPRFSVDAEVPPVLAAVAFRVIYPPYTGLPPEDRDAGNLSILAGSHLRITATTAAAARSATIRLAGMTPAQSVEMKVDATGKVFSGDVFVPAKNLNGLSIHLVSPSGFPSIEETVYPVYPVPDLPPVVKLVTPSAEPDTVVQQAHPIFVAEASDDYGLARFSLKYQASIPGAVDGPPEAGPVVEVPLTIDHPKTSHAQCTVDIAGQTPTWIEGTHVIYWIEATDNNNVTGPGVTRSPPMHLNVVSLAEKEKEIADRLQQAANSLDSAAEAQDKVAGQFNALHR